MAKDQDSTDESQKTEDPTQHRLDEAFKEGQVSLSREVLHWFVLAGSSVLIFYIFPITVPQLMSLMKAFIAMPGQIIVSENHFLRLSYEIIKYLLLFIFTPFLIINLLVVAVGLAQTRMNFSVKSLKPKLDHFSPIKGLHKIFGKQAIIEFLKNSLKILIIGCGIFWSIKSFLPIVHDSFLSPISMVWNLFEIILFRIFLVTLIVLGFVSILDAVYQRFRFIKQLKMSRHDIKQEHKDLEGDPTIKSKMKQKRLSQYKKRMMAAVPKATVVVTNPTHYAVALKYDMDTMPAPKVVCKAQGELVKHVKSLASRYNIPIIENKAFARILFTDSKLNHWINREHFPMAAMIFRDIYRQRETQ